MLPAKSLMLIGRAAVRLLPPAALLAAVGAQALPAAAAEARWQSAALGAAAILPPPGESGRIVGGSLSCAEQRWQLLLRSEASATPQSGPEKALITIGGDQFQADARWTDGSLVVAVAADVLEAMKSGSRLSVALAGGSKGIGASFALTGSRQAIEAATPRCSPIEMSGYRQVTFAAAYPLAGVAASLMGDEARLYREATGKAPHVAAATVDLSGGRSLLFATLCGSTSYYGASGCTLAGYAAEGGSGWREVYNTDGVRLYIDPRVAGDGWPDLVTVPAAGDAEPSRWRWDGQAYAPPAPVVAEDVFGGADVRQMLRQ